ncbi:MAG: hypothetical protein EOP84_00730, partial [Verrucomicrobiaceae bacterium]
MIDVIKLFSGKARMNPQALAIAAVLPLYQSRNLNHSRAYDSTLAIVRLGNADRRFVTVKFLVKKGEATRLIGVDANLPAILFGHNGRLIKTQAQKLMAFTILRFLIAPLVHPDDIRLILPGRDEDNDSYIRAIECPLQFQDPGAELLLAAHLSGCRNFTRASQIYPGESVLHRSSGLDLAIYDKLAESKLGDSLPVAVPCTRVEVRFKTPRRLLEALSFGASKAWVPAAMPFDALFYAFQNVITHSLVGAPANPPVTEPKQLKKATRSILKLASDHVSLLAALAAQSSLKSHAEYGKIRREVLHGLARLHAVSLPSMIEEFP